ncbi:integrase/recombinase XerD [Paenibacillus cellulosilyticus]|uniref:Integrase/recombinase XerD n=1 Tax=Paenibacillus cellulosilyticus TaxID=375489 RepID=A0A2V2YNY8_9BACL|nr:tyrosine-type recombinase/integrase [Paenibacillus cellulosilyticus]PWV97395.1 integrase/recombinase XerD [Paenibacillus cellulosilyticus]QKS48564.1 tyrosine-type recombinase/integrase [Paenibacillus cellulosilyticus]
MSNDPRKGKPSVRGKRNAAPTSLKSTIGLDEAFELFFNAKKAEGIRESTLTKEYIPNWRYFRNWLSTAYPHAGLVDISASVIREYVNRISTRSKFEDAPHRLQESITLSPYTVALRLRTLRTIFNFLSRENIIPDSPVTTIKQPRFDEEDKETFTDEQLRKLLAAPDRDTFAGLRDHTLMLVLADSGLRIQEALRLTTEYLDVKARCFHLPAWMNKNRKPRIVPISSEVLREVTALLTENKMHFDTEYLFISNYGDPLKADHFRKRLKVHAKTAGIDKVCNIHPHAFRAYFCTNFLLGGGDLFSLQRIVAHSSIETTRRYMRVNDENIRQQHANFSPITKLGMTRIGRIRGKQ